MSTPHPDVGPELRRLAQAVLDRLDPAVRAAAAMATETLSGPGRCQQVWCPVCALAALVNGEQHPLLTVIADHSGALLAVIRTMVTDPAADSTGEESPSGCGPDGRPGTGGGHDSVDTGAARYQGIEIVVEPMLVEE